MKVWVCTGCQRVFDKPRPTKGRGGQNAEQRHKVYPNTQRGSREATFKLGPQQWCGPIVEGEVVVQSLQASGPGAG